jgi:hypothetical protein
MATTYSVLAQANPSATTETTLLTASGTSGTVVSSLVICNQASSTATYRVAVRPSGQSSTTAPNWIVYGASVNANDSTILTIGLTLASGDKVQIYASTSTLSFSAFGSTIS